MIPTQVEVSLPEWVGSWTQLDRVVPDDAGKVLLAIELSRLNVEAGTGGPFGAIVFGPDHRIIALGVNRVLPTHTSLAHAENMAYMLAQQKLRSPRINEAAGGPVTLATSSQPCCQCFGATMWAGIDRLLVGARGDDVEALTEFDEGPLPQDWVGELSRRGIELVRDLHREAACEVLRAYGQRGGQRY